ncbi:phenylalanine--tRNA ligase subunit beta [Conexibacter sp. DBS9H8]|uniref:phenylalanine--tRNA ligase subunit beta n=1 Tax=Conexibacter sp. DBS9H8 TaxID=2937801 RepID=UPI00200EE3AD|nr:phenylalanine--tRNA ligase subunit beta [Conexibacter sp. DBS9H8]
MRVPLDWLSEYCAPALSATELAAALALTGTEVERVEHHGVATPDGFVVGHVLEATKHPDADRLRVCVVEIGDGEPRQIVCGAPNVAAGLTVAVAQPGSVMPDGTRLKKAKLRGQESHGMILSERELAISAEHDGIMVLPGTPAPGTPLAEVIPIGTDVLVLEITPNRPDCLGIYGVAREVHAATGAPLAPEPWAEDPGSLGPLAGVEITNAAGPELNPRFTARIFGGVRVGPSPIWLKARLMAAGMRPISNVVDITNYVMLVTGQPMHAFDLDRVAGRRLNVRRARAGETVETLDGQARTLDPDIVLIEDADGPTSIAGVMGGARSEVSETTSTVLAEVATWNGPNIHETALKLALNSEAASRNAKGLAPEQTLWAQALATRMFRELTGATVSPGTLDLGGDGPAPAKIALRTARIAALLGTEVPRERAAEVLDALGFTTAATPEGLAVTVPPVRRTDVTREVDLIEEIARLAVLGDLPATLPRRSGSGALSARQRLRRRAADLLAGAGLSEVVGWSFAAPDQNARLRLADPAVTLANPMSADHSRLRTTLLGSVLDVAAHNRAQGAERIAIFEMGAVYRPERIAPRAEDVHALALLTGPVRTPTWREPAPPPADVFAAKGVAEVLLDGLGIAWELVPGQALATLHPTRSAVVQVNGHRVGFLAEVHPEVAAAWDLGPGPVAVAAINLDALALPETRQARDLTSFPSLREDLAVVLPDTVSAAELLAVIGAAAGPLLHSADVFDVYRDSARLGAGRYSVAVRLHFRASDRTLTNEEVAVKRGRIIAAVADQLEGTIRA